MCNHRTACRVLYQPKTPAGLSACQDDVSSLDQDWSLDQDEYSPPLVLTEAASARSSSGAASSYVLPLVSHPRADV